MSITRETWTQCRADYITGKGSLAQMSAKHGLKRGSVEKCAKREGWKRLRDDFEASQLAKLIPAPLPSLPCAPVAPGGAVSEDWLRERQSLYYRDNTALVDKVRKLLDAKLTNGADLDADELARLTTALGGIVTAESQLLGLKDRRKHQPRRQAMIEPIARPTPTEQAQAQ